MLPKGQTWSESFFDHYGVRHHTTVLSDNGNSFKENGADIFDLLEFERHYCYPAAVHQFLSPNDNRLHGAAKQLWRSSFGDFDDDVHSSIYLLHMLDVCNKDVKDYFNKNMQLDQQTPTMKPVRDIIQGEKVSETDYYRECIREYRVFMCEDARGALPDDPAGLTSGLDGRYWEE